MDLGLQGKWALVCGASRGLGWGCARALALEGVNVLFIGVGPAVLAYRSWGAGVALAGPTRAGFFMNLTPFFAALLSAAFLGEPPQAFHAAAFVLIVSGIVLSSKR